MKYRKLRDIEVSAVGIGCMGFSHGYGAIPTEEESIRLMHKAYDLGCTLFDTAEAYGPFTNETLVGKAVKPFRDKTEIKLYLQQNLFLYSSRGRKFRKGNSARKVLQMR